MLCWLDGDELIGAEIRGCVGNETFLVVYVWARNRGCLLVRYVCGKSWHRVGVVASRAFDGREPGWCNLEVFSDVEVVFKNGLSSPSSSPWPHCSPLRSLAGTRPC